MAKNTFDILRKVVAEVRSKPGWQFRLIDDDEGFRLVITDTLCQNAYLPHDSFPLSHYFPVPTTTWNEKSWRGWVFQCCQGVENHELGEWVRWGDERPFAPLHGPGENPYVVHEFRSDIERRTTQDGSIRGS